MSQYSPWALAGWALILAGALGLEIAANFTPKVPFLTTLILRFIPPPIEAALLGLLTWHFLIQHAKIFGGGK